MADSRYKLAELSDRLERFVGNSLYSDFKFLIENNNVEIPAHKFILASASPILEKIVNGSEEISSADVTSVDGISKEVFMEIIRYIYTDKVEIDDGNVFDILSKANYFELAKLEGHCFSYLKKRLDQSSVTWIFHQLYNSFPSSQMFRICVEFIQSYPQSFFNSEDFQHISVAEFKLILQQDAINCSEFYLFEAMIKLAKNQCILNGVEVTVANQRKFLDGAEKLLRLEVTTKFGFNKCLALQPDFFSSKEKERIQAVLDGLISTTVRGRKGLRLLLSGQEEEETNRIFKEKHLSPKERAEIEKEIEKEIAEEMKNELIRALQEEDEEESVRRSGTEKWLKDWTKLESQDVFACKTCGVERCTDWTKLESQDVFPCTTCGAERYYGKQREGHDVFGFFRTQRRGPGERWSYRNEYCIQDCNYSSRLY